MEGSDGAAGRGGLLLPWKSNDVWRHQELTHPLRMLARRGDCRCAFWRQNARRGSSFHEYPAKRVVLTLGDSPAWLAYAPVAPTVVGAFAHMTPTRGIHPVQSHAHRRTTRTSAKTRIRHNAEFCVLTRRRQAQPSLPPYPDAHITRNSPHKHEFGIISLLGRRSARKEAMIRMNKIEPIKTNNSIFPRPSFEITIATALDANNE